MAPPRRWYKRLPQGAVADTSKPLDAILDEGRQLAATLVTRTAEALNDLYPKSYLQSLFKNAAKCKEVDVKLAGAPLNTTLPLPLPTGS